MPGQWVDLHLHTTYSLLDAYGSPNHVIERAAELQRPAVAITDHGSISGHAFFEREAQKAGIKPIFGCEFYVVEDIEHNSQKKRHLTVLAKNQTGYRNLLKLASDSYRAGFYYRPTIDGPMLQSHGEGLIILSGCTLSHTSAMLLAGDEGAATVMMQRFWRQWGSDYFLEVQPSPFADCRVVNNAIMRISQKTGIPIIVTNDVHYPTQGQQRIRQLLHAIRDHKTFDEIEMSGEHYQLSYDELVAHARMGEIDSIIHQAAERTLRVAADCNVTLEKTGFVEFPLPDGAPDKATYLKQLILDGLRERGLIDNPIYRERAAHEFAIIQEKQFVDYFLVVADLINYAKRENIMVGPARGSAAGSLLCYALRITEVDPIKWDLIFERFIDITRDDYPDIDIDIEDERRSQVRAYMQRRYGPERVANIAVFTAFKGRNAIDDVGKAHQLSKEDITRVKRVAIYYNAGDARFFNGIEDTFASYDVAREVAERRPEILDSIKIEGQYRSMGMHAAGIVLSPNDLDRHVPLYWKNGEAIVGYDLTDCQYMGLVKIDLLGLIALTRLRQMGDAVGMSITDIFNIDLDDQQTLDAFRRQDILGIFQFEGEAMRTILREMADLRRGIIDLVDINALSRPGPFYGGGTQGYLSNRRRNEQEYDVIHPVVMQYTRETFGQILYQEQVLKIARELGRLSWANTGGMRRAIGKSLGREKFDTFRQMFVEGAREQHVTEDVANAIFDAMVTFGSYAFNKAHSVSYTIVGYWTMWFKAHYPHQFYMTMMATEDDDVKMRQYAREYMSRGGRIFGPHINLSQYSWSLNDQLGGMIAGFTNIDQIGDRVAVEVLKARSDGHFRDHDDLTSRVRKNILTRSRLDALEQAGCFDPPSERDYLGLAREEEMFSAYRASHRIGEITVDLDATIDVIGRIFDRSQKQEGTAVFRLIDHTGAYQFRLNEKAYAKVRSKFWECADGDLVRTVAYKKGGFGIAFSNTFEFVTKGPSKRDNLVVRGVDHAQTPA